MKNIHRFFREGVCLAVLPALALLLVSCGQGSQNLKEYDISEIYGYTFYGNITASSGTTCKQGKQNECRFVLLLCRKKRGK